MSSKRSEKIRVIILSPQTVSEYETMGGGALRIFNLYSRLAQRDEIEKLTLITPTFKLKNLFSFSSVLKYEVSEGFEEVRFFSPLTTLLRLFTERMYGQIGVAFASSRKIWSIVKSDMSRNSEYLIMVERPWLIKQGILLKRFLEREGIKAILVHSSQNIELDLIFNRGRRLASLFSRKSAAIEGDAFRSSQSCIVVSDDDKEKAVKIYKANPANIHVVENGVNAIDYSSISDRDMNEVREKFSIPTGKKLGIFIGSKYQPNIDGVNKYLMYINNNIAKLSGLHFVIVGGVGEALDQRYIDISNIVTVTGRISEEDLNRLLAIADFGLNFVESGSGSNLKNMSIFDASIPLLSTKFGARGFNLVAGQHYIEITPENFIETLLALKGDGNDTSIIVSSATQIVMKYTWDNLANKMADLLISNVYEKT